MHYLWDTLLYHPFVNLLAFLVSVIPGGDLGIAVILLTIIVRLLLYPLTQKSIEGQAKMNLLAPEITKIKESGASKEEQAKMTFDLYKKHKTNPFSGCLLVLIQIPVILALYFVFSKGISIDSSLLYSFVPRPETLNTMFLGLINISDKSLILALLAGISQYFQAHYMPHPPTPKKDSKDFAASFQKSLQMQMKYFFPIFIFILLYTDFLGVSLSGAVALYWITNNIFAILQQIRADKKHKLELVEVK